VRPFFSDILANGNRMTGEAKQEDCVLSSGHSSQTLNEESMSSGPHRFTEAEVRRMIRITERAGLEVKRIDYHRDSSGTTFSIIPGKPGTSPRDAEPDPGEWPMS
jgi:hypothetical protein